MWLHHIFFLEHTVTLKIQTLSHPVHPPLPCALWRNGSPFQHLVMNRLRSVLTLQKKKACQVCVHCESLFTVLKHLAAAPLLPPQPFLWVDEGVCAFPRPKHSLPRDYPSFCSEPLELLTQRLLTEKLCICMCLTPLPSTVHGNITDTVVCFWYCRSSSFHWLLFTVTGQICTYCTLYFTL